MADGREEGREVAKDGREMETGERDRGRGDEAKFLGW